MANEQDRASKADVQSTELNKLPTEEEMNETQLSAESAAEVFENEQ